MSEVAQTLGQRLKAERERRGVSKQKAADEMHLDAWVIDALETGDYQRIGPPVYAKGHLKRYATILGLPTAEVASGYDTKPASPASGRIAALERADALYRAGIRGRPAMDQNDGLRGNRRGGRRHHLVAAVASAIERRAPRRRPACRQAHRRRAR